MDRLIHGAFPHAERLGFHITRNHFYEPIPEIRSIDDSVFEREFDLPGVDLRESAQVEFLADVVPTYRAEYEAFLPGEPEPPAYGFENGQFERVDAEILYCMVRSRRPSRVIEIGGGFSSLITLEALRRNGADGAGGSLLTIEPYPRAFLEAGVPGPFELRTDAVQAVPIDEFERLTRNDILFIDSSHVVKIGSDAQYELLEILPRLRPGVVVHVHDVFLPLEYPKAFIKEWHRFWNEQYVLQAFLAFNDDFEVLWGSSLMTCRHKDLLLEAFPSFHRRGLWPSSFWMRRVE